MKCLVCGGELPQGAKFCGACGSRVVEQGNLGVNNINIDNQINNLDNNVLQNNNFESGTIATNTVTNSESVNNVNNQPNLINNSFDRGFNSNTVDSLNTNNGVNYGINQPMGINSINNVEPVANNNLTGMDSVVNPVNVNSTSNVEPVINNNLSGVNNVVEPINISGINNSDPVVTNVSSDNNINQSVAMPDINNTNPIEGNTPLTNNVVNKPKKKNNIIPILIVAIFVFVILIGGAGFLVWNFFLKTNPRQVFIKGMQDVTNTLFTANNESYDSVTTNFDFQSNVSTNDASLNQIFDITNKVGLSGSFGIDYKNKIMNGNVLVNYNNEKLTDIVLYGENSNFYLYLERLYDKYIQVPFGAYNDLFEANAKDLEVLRTSINKAFDTALKDEYLDSKKETITIKGKDKKVTSSILNLNKENSSQFFSDFCGVLSEDLEFVKLFASVVGISEDELKTALTAEDINFSEGEEVIITIYTDKNKFIGLNMQVTEGEEKNSIDLFKIDEFNYNMVLNSGETNVSVDVNIKNYSSKKTYTISSVDDLYNIEVILSEEPSYNEPIAPIDVTNSINYSLLTDEDINAIENNLMNNNVFMKIMLDIYGASESMEDSSSALEGIDEGIITDDYYEVEEDILVDDYSEDDL